MKTIVFIRHAKSSWDEDVEDIKRPLSKRGYTDANLVSKEFKTINFYPDAVFSSPATRAFTTSTIFMDNLGYSNDLRFVEEPLYDFGGNQVRQFINHLDDHLQKIIVFGHNYALTTLVNNLGDSYIDNLPTSGLVMIDFDVDRWNQVNRGKTTLILTPKALK